MVRVVLPRRRVLAVMGGGLATPFLASAIARAADDWPNRPVRYVNLIPAGGATRAARAAMSAPTRSPSRRPTATRSG